MTLEARAIKQFTPEYPQRVKPFNVNVFTATETTLMSYLSIPYPEGKQKLVVYRHSSPSGLYKFEANILPNTLGNELRGFNLDDVTENPQEIQSLSKVAISEDKLGRRIINKDVWATEQLSKGQSLVLTSNETQIRIVRQGNDVLVSSEIDGEYKGGRTIKNGYFQAIGSNVEPQLAIAFVGDKLTFIKPGHNEIAIEKYEGDMRIDFANDSREKKMLELNSISVPVVISQLSPSGAIPIMAIDSLPRAEKQGVDSLLVVSSLTGKSGVIKPERNILGLYSSPKIEEVAQMGIPIFKDGLSFSYPKKAENESVRSIGLQYDSNRYSVEPITQIGYEDLRYGTFMLSSGKWYSVPINSSPHINFGSPDSNYKLVINSKFSSGHSKLQLLSRGLVDYEKEMSTEGDFIALRNPHGARIKNAATVNIPGFREVFPHELIIAQSGVNLFLYASEMNGRMFIKGANGN